MTNWPLSKLDTELFINCPATKYILNYGQPDVIQLGLEVEAAI